MNGERAKKRRKELKLSSEKIAQELGTTRVTVLRWENGTSEPDDRTKIALARILDTSVAYLIGETDNPERDGAATMPDIHLQTQSKREPMSTNYAYWGGVVDEAHKVVERGNVIEIASIESLLRLAYDTVASGMDKLVHNDCSTGLDKTVVAQMPVYGGYHNKNSLTVGATA